MSTGYYCLLLDCSAESMGKVQTNQEYSRRERRPPFADPSCSGSHLPYSSRLGPSRQNYSVDSILFGPVKQDLQKMHGGGVGGTERENEKQLCFPFLAQYSGQILRDSFRAAAETKPTSPPCYPKLPANFYSLGKGFW